MKKLGYVLSGGGAKCIAHLGCIKALQEWGYQPSIISGVSGGAIYGAGLASGQEVNSILEKMETVGSLSWFYPTLKKGGLFSISRIKDLLNQDIPENFEDLKTPLVVNATNLLTGECIYLSSGNLLDSILASATYPGIFAPVHLNGMELIDGGISNNLPYEPLEGKCDKIIGFSTGFIGKINKKPGVQGTFLRALSIAITEHDKHRVKACDFVFQSPGIENFGLFDTHKSMEIFEIGYRYALSQKEKFENMINQ